MPSSQLRPSANDTFAHDFVPLYSATDRGPCSAMIVLQPRRDLVHRLSRSGSPRTFRHVAGAGWRGAGAGRGAACGSWRPFSHVKPCETAWSRSPRTATTLVVVDVDLDAAVRVAEAADRGVRLDRRHALPPTRLDMLCKHSARGSWPHDSGESEWRRICRVHACWSSARRPGSGGASPSRRSAPGAAVVFSARSRDKLEDAVAEAGGGVVVVGDVRDPDDCTRILDETVDALGGLDLLVFATGVSPLMPMEDTPAETIHDVFATNTIGGLDAAHRGGHAGSADGGIVAYLGSDSVGAAYPGMVHYAASKAALDQGVDGLRMEFPDTRFLRIAVGPDRGYRDRPRLRPGDHRPDAARRCCGSRAAPRSS